MSYILDALKRAERERKQGQVSVLDEVHASATEPQPLRRQPPWLWLALGAAAAGAMVYAGMVLSNRHAAAAAPPASAVVPATPLQTAAPPPAAPAAAVPAIPLAAGPATPIVQATPAPPPSATIENPSRITTVEDVVGGNQTEAAAVAPAKRAMMPAAQSGEDTASAAPAPAPEPSESPVAEPATAASLPTEMPALKEMPDDYRAQFPPISIAVHVYNEDPQRRFVLVNGKRYKEGETLAEGPRIVAIVPEGIVFDWQGRRVLYASR